MVLLVWMMLLLLVLVLVWMVLQRRGVGVVWMVRRGRHLPVVLVLVAPPCCEHKRWWMFLRRTMRGGRPVDDERVLPTLRLLQHPLVSGSSAIKLRKPALQFLVAGKFAYL